MPQNFGQNLELWLSHAERLHPKTIDLELRRVRAVLARMGLHLECPIFTVTGTNGKGSTCAFLESILTQAGWRTGLYTSPHLVRYEERCRIGGQTVKAEDLAQAFASVEAARGQESLTYFEFGTLAALHLFSHSPLDALILEVGLGGRLDACNAVDPDCAVITCVELDHQQLLGNTREAIGHEKVAIARKGKPLIVGQAHPPQSVIEGAGALGADLWLLGRDFSFSAGSQQWSWSGRQRKWPALAPPYMRGTNQLANASAALAALEALCHKLPVTAQAVRQGLALAHLPARFEIVPGRPTLVLDVAHNPHAAATLALNLDDMGFFPTTHAVFGAMADKDYAQILTIMDKVVDHWYFTDLPTPRAARAAHLYQAWAGAQRRSQCGAEHYASPEQALLAAAARATPMDRIVVFGSFFTVGGVLLEGTPRLTASTAPPHPPHH